MLALPVTAQDDDEEGSTSEGWLDDVFDNGMLDDMTGFFVPQGARILLIVAVALVFHILVRRAIARFARRMTDPEATQRLSRLRDRAPAVVAKSSVFAERSSARAQTLAQVLRSVATAVIWTLALVTVLAELHVQVGPLVAGAGIAGVALGFGAQSLVKDFLTGFFMLVEDQCGVGDFVDLGEAVGKVEAVSLRVTRVRDVTGTLWHIPNGQIERVANHSQEWSRALLDVAVSYTTPPDVAKQVIKNAADEMWRDPEWNADILEEPEVWGVQEFGPDAMLIRLVVRTEPAEQWRVMRELRRRLWMTFDEHGIEIPFPQRTVRLRPEVDVAQAVADTISGSTNAKASRDMGSGSD